MERTKVEEREEFFKKLQKYKENEKLLKAATLVEQFWPDLPKDYVNTAKRAIKYILDRKSSVPNNGATLSRIVEDLQEMEKMAWIMKEMRIMVVSAREFFSIAAAVWDARTMMGHYNPAHGIGELLEKKMSEESSPKEIEQATRRKFMELGFPKKFDLLK